MPNIIPSTRRAPTRCAHHRPVQGGGRRSLVTVRDESGRLRLNKSRDRWFKSCPYQSNLSRKPATQSAVFPPTPCTVNRCSRPRQALTRAHHVLLVSTQNIAAHEDRSGAASRRASPEQPCLHGAVVARRQWGQLSIGRVTRTEGPSLDRSSSRRRAGK